MRPHYIITNEGRHEDPLPDDEVPLWFLIGQVPVVVPGDHHGSVLGGIVQDERVVVTGDDFIVELPARGVDEMSLLSQFLQGNSLALGQLS